VISCDLLDSLSLVASLSVVTVYGIYKIHAFSDILNKILPMLLKPFLCPSCAPSAIWFPLEPLLRNYSIIRHTIISIGRVQHIAQRCTSFTFLLVAFFTFLMLSCIACYTSLFCFSITLSTVQRENMRSAGASKLPAFTYTEMSILFDTLTDSVSVRNTGALS